MHAIRGNCNPLLYSEIITVARSLYIFGLGKWGAEDYKRHSAEDSVCTHMFLFGNRYFVYMKSSAIPICGKIRVNVIDI